MEMPVKLRSSPRPEREVVAETPGLAAELAEARTLILDKDATIAELGRRVEHYEKFMRVLGHELRSPLTTIITTAELVSRKVRQPEIQEMLFRAERNGRRMDRMLEQLLDVARLRAGAGLSMSPSENDLESICRQVQDDLAETLPAHHVAIETLGSAIGMWDNYRITQAVGTLLGNAIEHTTHPRDVQVWIDGTRPDAVSLAVHNRGAIAPSLQKTIFDPPFERKPPGTRKPQGLGFGLFVSREIARAHGGNVTMSSSEEEGTRFVLELPRGSRR